jgi:hypothetical protein
MKTNETGHYKNVTSLQALKVFAEGLGTDYNPQKDALKLPSIILLSESSIRLHDEVRNQINTVSLTVDERQLVFENVKPLSTRVINTMSSTNVDPKTITDAKFFNAKIQGSRIGKKTKSEDGEKDGSSTSVSRQSYDSLYENFKSIVDLLEQDGNYTPFESELTIAGLTTKLNEMKAANEAITLQVNTLGQKRILRNSKFYVDSDCLITVGREIKKYIRGKFGIKSAQFSQISHITFKDYKLK